MLSGGDSKRCLAAVLLLLSVFIPVSLSVALQPAGDVAPYGNPDGQLNAADLVIVLQFLNGQKTPTTQEEQICDVAPYGSPDGVLNVGDYLVLQRAVMGLISLDPIGTPLQPLLWGGASPTDASPYYVSGLTDPNVTVQLYRDGVSQGSTFSNSNGLFSFNITLVAGAVHSITAVSVQGGLQSAPSAPLTIMMLAQPAPADLTQIAITYNATDTSIVGQAGSVAANSTVTITLVDGSTYTATAYSDGSFNKTIGDTDLVASFTVDTGSGKVSDPAIVTAVGTIAGKFDVDQTGTATYSIPIAVPPGTAGMTPSISVNYSSRSGNGTLGYGMSLGGLSRIHRCPQTIAQDGNPGGVNINASDRFCLDGQRLMVVSGNYGDDGAEYRTEVESFTKVISIGGDGVTPDSFMAWTKAGQVIEYGGTVDSKVNPQGVGILLWAANRIQDKVGNYYDITYVSGTSGEQYPSRIDYTGNASVGLSPYDSIQFIYDLARPDPSYSYVGGASIASTVLLKNIQVFEGASAVRDYRLLYEQGQMTGISRVSSITECESNAADAVCIPPTRFLWTGGVSFAYGWFNSNIPSNGSNAQVADVNNDGKQDIAIYESNKWGYITCSTGSSQAVCSQHFTSGSLSGWNYGRTIDYNSDGKTDFIYPDGNTNTWHVFLSASSPNIDTQIPRDGYANDPQIMDVNGDARADLVYVTGNVWKIRLNSASGFGAEINTGISALSLQKHARQIDYNNDGMMDLLWFQPAVNNHWWIMQSTGDDFQLVDTGVQNAAYNKNTLVLDINGDGLLDVAVPDNVWKIWINKGGAFSNSINTGMPNGDWQYAKPGDYNADGRMDIYIHNYPYWDVYQSNGESFTHISNVANGVSPSTTLLVDFTGDGFLQPASSYNGTWTVQHVTAQRESQLTDIYNGLGVNTHLSFAPLTNPNVYSQNQAIQPSFPEQNYVGPLNVVQYVHIDDGIGGGNYTYYKYADARIHLQGRGMLGFNKFQSYNQNTGITAENVLHQSFPYTGMVLRSVNQASNGAGGNPVISLTYNYYDQVAIGGASGVISPFLTSSQEYISSLSGGSSYKSTLTTYDYDSTYGEYGNPGTIVVASTANGETFTKTTVNTYDPPDTNAWILDRVNLTTVTHSAPGRPDIVKSSGFSYYSSASQHPGLLEEEVIEPGEPDTSPFKLKTSYEYDDFGNVIKVTKTALSGYEPTSGLENRIDQTLYDGQGRFKLGSQNALTQEETYQYDPRYGVLTRISGPNNLSTTWEYDGFGRKARETRADGSETTWDLAFCNATECPDGGFIETVNSSGTAPLVQYYDALQRVTTTRTFALNGQAVNQNVTYDINGNVAQRGIVWVIFA